MTSASLGSVAARIGLLGVLALSGCNDSGPLEPPTCPAGPCDNADPVVRLTVDRTVLPLGGALTATVTYFNRMADTMNVFTGPCWIDLTAYDLHDKAAGPLVRVCPPVGPGFTRVAPGDSLAQQTVWHADMGYREDNFRIAIPVGTYSPVARIVISPRPFNNAGATQIQGAGLKIQIR